MASIEEIRAALTEKENKAYLNYQLQRWIDAKAGIKEDVLRAIRRQKVVEKRLKAILQDSVRLKRTIHELNRGVLSFVHVKEQRQVEQRQVVVYVDLRNKTRVVDRDAEADCLILFMYYFAKQLEVMEGEGAHADLLVHQTEGPMPPYGDLKAELNIFSVVVGLSFPAVFDFIGLCCGSTSFYRSTCTATAEQAGLPVSFVAPDDIVSRYGPAHVPRILGGEYDTDTGQPMGTQVQRFFQGDTQKAYLELLPGWEIEEQEDEVDADLFEDNIGPTWATLLAESLQLPEAKATTPEALRHTPSAQRMWLTCLLGLAMAALLNSIPLLVLFILVLIHVCVFYQSILQAGSHLLAGGDALDNLAVRVLEKQLEQLTRLLEPMTLFCVPQMMQTDEKTILAFASLDLEMKVQIKACIQVIQMTVSQLPTNVVMATEHQATYKRSEQMYNWLRTITSAKMACVHCGKHGTMDFLDAHLRDQGDAIRSKLQHAEKYSARRRRKHSKHVEEPKFQRGTTEVATSSGDGIAHSPSIEETLRRSSASMPNLLKSPMGANTSPDLRATRTALLSSLQASPSTASAQNLPSLAFQNMSSPSTRSSRSELKITDLGQGYDRHAKQCMACDSKFGPFRRRHWCRRCRKTICAGCAAVSLSTLKRKNPQCMCKPCAYECGNSGEEFPYSDNMPDVDEDSDN